jgi:Cof subfamily protein (haloacid dehalogenase superfamily)
MTYRVIALDLDGTLLTQTKQILPESIEVLAQARRQGVKVVIVTGRHHVAIRPFYHALELDTPALCCNGTYMYDFSQQQVMKSNPLTLPQSLRVIELLKEYNVHSLMYTDSAMTYEEPDDTIARWGVWSARLPESQRPNIIQVARFDDAAKQAGAIWKFATMSNDIDSLHSFSQVIENELNLTCEFSWHNQMDIAQTGNSKGNLLKSWVTQQGLDMNNVIAFGDNFNDLSMIEMSGLGVAMENSADDIKAKADLVTTTNESAGIADVIRQYVLR